MPPTLWAETELPPYSPHRCRLGYHPSEALLVEQNALPPFVASPFFQSHVVQPKLSEKNRLTTCYSNGKNYPLSHKEHDKHSRITFPIYIQSTSVANKIPHSLENKYILGLPFNHQFIPFVRSAKVKFSLVMNSFPAESLRKGT